MAVTVRSATEADLQQFLDLLEVVAAERIYIGTEAPLDREHHRESFRARLASRSEAELLAVDEGEIVGMIGLTDRGGLVGLGMLVVPDRRGRGIGTALMRAGLDWARSRGAHKVELQVWPHNTAAIRLYENFGFVQEGYLTRHWKRRDGELWDAVIMGLLLEPGAPAGDQGDGSRLV